MRNEPVVRVYSTLAKRPFSFREFQIIEAAEAVADGGFNSFRQLGCLVGS